MFSKFLVHVLRKPDEFYLYEHWKINEWNLIFFFSNLPEQALCKYRLMDTEVYASD